AAGTLFMSATMAQAALTDNLIAHFQFENNLNSSGSVVLAAPSVTGTPTYEAGQDPYFGNALRLPGASGFYVQYDSDTTPLSLTGGTSYTVSFQFRLEGNSGQHSDRIFATDGGDAPGLNAWGMRIDNAANNRQFHWRHGGNPEHASGTPLELDRWYNVAVVYDADTDWLRVIVDGKVVNAVQPTPNITHASDLRI